MKNQYFGDINDYRKYGLLRTLLATGTRKLLVAWMLTPDDGSPDGSRRSYLSSPDKWQHFDPDLYTGLSTLLQAGTIPKVSLIESSNLLPRTSFYTAAVHDVREKRDAWRRGMLSVASGVDVVFVDPDNGIEVPSKPIGRTNSSKYVAWEELKKIWDAGCSLIIYQHFPHKTRETFTARIVTELRQRTGATFVKALRTDHVLFLLVGQIKHETIFQRAISYAVTCWEGQITDTTEI